MGFCKSQNSEVAGSHLYLVLRAKEILTLVLLRESPVPMGQPHWDELFLYEPQRVVSVYLDFTASFFQLSANISGFLRRKLEGL